MSVEQTAAEGLTVLTPDGVPDGEDASTALARASRQADELAAVLARTGDCYAGTVPPVVARVLELAADQLGGMHVTFDELAEQLLVSPRRYEEAA